MGTKRITDQTLLSELKRVAKELNNDTVSVLEFNKYGEISPKTYFNRFGSWKKALEKAELTGNRSATLKNGYKMKKTIVRREVLNSKLASFILKRDCYKCVLCGNSPAIDENIKLHIDHVKPVYHGGQNSQWNLWTLCQSCNLRKSKKYEPETSWKASDHIAKKYFGKELA